MILRATVAALVVGAATGQCGSSGFKVAGSSTVYPVAESWAKGYAAKCGKVAITGEPIATLTSGTDANVIVAGGGSGVGASKVCNGEVDIGNMSREWRTSEATRPNDDWNYNCVLSPNRAVTRVDVAIDGVTVVVKRGGTGSKCIGFLKGLTPEQLRYMYSNLSKQALIQSGWPESALALGTGNGRLWNALHKSCAAKEINLSGPDQANSGTADFFKEKIFKASGETIFLQGSRPYRGSISDGDTLTYIKNDDAAVGFFGYAYYFSNSGAVFAASIKNRFGKYVAPNKDTILSNEYNPLTRRIYMNVNKASLPQTRPYLEYGYSPAGDGKVAATGSDPIPAADQILMLSRIGSASGIDIADIECETNGVVRVGTASPAQRSRFNIWSLLYTAKCAKVDVILSSIAATPTTKGAAQACTTGATALEVGATSALVSKATYKVTDKNFVLSCPAPSKKKIIELTMSPGVFAYVNNADAVLPISRGFLRFCLSAQGDVLLGKIGLTANTRAISNDMLTRIPKPTGGFGCFSGSDTVAVLGRGVVDMRNLVIGDMVQVAGGKFSQIYSFGHYEHDVEASFLSIDAGLEKPLVLTGDHMVFVDDKAVAASMLSVGDKLSLVDGFAVVKAIKAVTEIGVFAPFTKDGTIVVNSVVASSYVNLKGDASLVVGGIAFDLHWLAHLSQAPHRLACEISSSFCASETYNKGVSVWVETPLAVSVWLVEQNPVVMTVVFFPAFAFVLLAAAVESIISSPALLLILVATAFAMASKVKKSA